MRLCRTISRSIDRPINDIWAEAHAPTLARLTTDLLAFRVKSGSSLVEKQYGRVLDDGTSDGYALRDTETTPRKKERIAGKKNRTEQNSTNSRCGDEYM